MSARKVPDNYDVAICMPYYERKKPLEETLKRFIEYGYFDDGRTILSIVDDGSMSQPIAKEDEMFDDIPLVLSHRSKKGCWMNPSTVINQAVRQTVAPVIILQSPETMHPEPILHRILEGMKTWDTVIGVSCWGERKRLKGGGYWYCSEKNPVVFWWCQTMSREMFELVGGFDERYRDGKAGEDNDFCIRLAAKNPKWKWLKGVHVVHQETEHDWGGWSTRPAKRKVKGDPNIHLLKKTYGNLNLPKIKPEFI